MENKLARLLSLVLIAGLFLSLGFTPSTAQDLQPQYPQRDADGLWYGQAGAYQPLAQPEMGLLAIGGPNDFGYTWSDEAADVTYDWVTAGTGTGISAENEVSGAIEIGFPFKFYENTYSQLYVSRHGYVGFDPAYLNNSQSVIPSPKPPNNVIAPYWAPFFYMPPGSYVRYTSGGDTFVVEWHRVAASADWDQEFTFELILHQNGDIVFQYHTIPTSGDVYYQSSGIEDISGLDGLPVYDFGAQIFSSSAVKIFRPASAARVSVDRLYQGALTQPGSTTSYEMIVSNTGEAGPDAYRLVYSSGWPVTFYAADGVSPLPQVGGFPTTGSIAQGASAKVIARVQTPTTAVIGSHSTTEAMFCSTQIVNICKTVHLQAAVPAPFVQVINAGGQGEQVFVRSTGIQSRDLFALGSNPAVLKLPNQTYITAWTAERCLGSACSVQVKEIHYTLISKAGTTLLDTTRLADHSSAVQDVADQSPVIAAAPDGRIGLLWLRRITNTAGAVNENLFFAILNSQGSLVYGPLNLTNNSAWGTIDTAGVPIFSDLSISAAGSNRFMLAWDRAQRVLPCAVDFCKLDDLYYTVRSSSGAVVTPITQYTTDNAAALDGYYDPALAPLSGGRVLLTWNREIDGQVYYAVFDSAGNKVWPLNTALGTALTDGDASAYNYNADAAQLMDGKIVVAWTHSGVSGTEIHYALLGADYTPPAAVIPLNMPTDVASADNVSVAAAGGRAVLTWMDYSWDYRSSLSYALVDSSTIITPPMVFHANTSDTLPVISNESGFGNASYSDFIETYLPLILR